MNKSKLLYSFLDECMGELNIVKNKKTLLLHRFAGGAYYIHGLSPSFKEPK
jgi:hypothetical protein